MAWKPRPRQFAYRTYKNKHPLIRAWDDERKRSDQQAIKDGFWQNMVRRVAEIERTLGTSVKLSGP